MRYFLRLRNLHIIRESESYLLQKKSNEPPISNIKIYTKLNLLLNEDFAAGSNLFDVVKLHRLVRIRYRKEVIGKSITQEFTRLHI